MTLQSDESVNMFDQYSLIVPAGLNCWKDGSQGKRILWIEDKEHRFTVSFEEGMQLMDMDTRLLHDTAKVRFHYQNGAKYLHQLRTIPEQRAGSGNYAFFHMELQDSSGKVFCLPGQMVAPYGYQWAEDVEPVLKKLLENASVLEEKQGERHGGE